MNAIKALLAESIDYAGLFPPAGLDMAAAVRNYAAYLAAPESWALGRFVVPANRLGEFEATAAGHLEQAPSNRPWRLSALAGEDLESDLDTIMRFNRHHSAADGRSAAVDTIEIKASSKPGIEEIMRRVSRDLPAFIEIPIDRDPAELLAALAGSGGRAKVRTGGVTPGAFPATADLLRFIRRSAETRVSFKATAGLHHPLRAEYRLTYAADSPSGPMFGFLNLFLAPAFLRAGLDDTELARLLEERSPDAFQADRQGISWRGHMLDVDAIRRARQEGIRSFGSCSFTEPLADLQTLHLLPQRVPQG